MGDPRQSPRAQAFVPALGRLGTRFYDPVVRLTTRERRFKSRLLDVAAIHSGERVLDLGCGTGTLAIRARQRTPDAHVVGLDADVSMLGHARRKATEANVDVEFESGSASAVPYPDGSFDVVVSSLFFHHLDRGSKLAVVRETVRVLRRGGRLVVADWGPPSDPLMRGLFLTIQLVDGFAVTRDSVTGLVPDILRSAGLIDVRERGRYRTVYGSLVLLHARSPEA